MNVFVDCPIRKKCFVTFFNNFFCKDLDREDLEMQRNMIFKKLTFTYKIFTLILIKTCISFDNNQRH